MFLKNDLTIFFNFNFYDIIEQIYLKYNIIFDGKKCII